MKRFSALILAGLLLSACTARSLDTAADPETPPAGIGSRVGSLIGLGSSNQQPTRSERNAALVSTGAKPLASAEATATMDKVEADLQANADKTVTVTRVGDQVVVGLQSDLLFDNKGDAVKRGAQSELNDIATVLTANAATTIDVFGYTDSNGDEKANFDLSQRRALSVADYLSGKGVDPRRFAVTGFGETRPAAENDTAAGRAKNRRIEIQVSPLT